MIPINKSTVLISAAYVLLLLAAAVPLAYRASLLKSTTTFSISDIAELDKAAASMTLGYACEACLVPAVHGASVIEKLNGGLLATWFGGSREGGKDVYIWGADYSPATHSWSVPRHIIGPAETRLALGRYIKTVGNSVLVRGKNGELQLYFTSVSVGGWAGSSLNVARSEDDGRSWGHPQRLITSPFFNISTIVKSVTVSYSDGSIGLPIYHEFIGKFSELLRLDNAGEIINKIRITNGRLAIQPLILPLSSQQAVALMRDTGANPRHVRMSNSTNAGQTWSAYERLQIPNPDSAVAGLRRPDGSLLLVFNDLENGRNSLALAVSKDHGKSWQTVKHFEVTSEGKSEYSYPYLIRNTNGTMHLLYTWNRQRIRHVTFNDNWIDGESP
jgi:predicted neuraminidase